MKEENKRTAIVPVYEADNKTFEDVISDPINSIYYVEEYRGIAYLVKKGLLSLVAYVNIKNLDESDIDLPVEITYWGVGIPFTYPNDYWSGWDYGHCNDYSVMDDFLDSTLGIKGSGTKWTPLMVKKQCMDVIDLFIDWEL